MFEELVRKNRSYRRFYEDIPVDRETLRGLVDLARTTPSATNRQPLRYMLSWTKERNDLIFPTLAWASYLPEWGGPAPGERFAVDPWETLDRFLAEARDAARARGKAAGRP